MIKNFSFTKFFAFTVFSFCYLTFFDGKISIASENCTHQNFERASVRKSSTDTKDLSKVQSLLLDRSSTRVQTTLKIDWKKIGTVRPRSVKEFSLDDNWTIGCETLDRDYIFWDTYKEYLAPLGIRRIRLQAGWAKTERIKGHYDFSWLDSIINDAKKRGLTIWLETDYGNSIYKGGGGVDLAGGFPTSEEALHAWDRWVETMAARYKDKIWAWAMWNEPDIGGYKNTPKKSPLQIADFNIRTAETIKRIIPNAKIAALSLGNTSPDFLKACLDRIAEKKKIGLFTWVIYHGYTMNPDSVYQNVEKMKKIVRQYDPPLTLWQGENGCPSEKVVNLALSNYDWTELTQAKWNARRMLGDLGHDVMSNIFCICDYYHPGRDTARFGLLKTNNHQNLAKVKSAYYTVQNVVSLFDGSLVRQKNDYCRFESDFPVTWFAYRSRELQTNKISLQNTVENTNHKATSSSAEKASAIENKQFQQKKNRDLPRDFLVFWDGRNIPSDSNKTSLCSIEIKKGKLTHPVWIDLVTGGVCEIPSENIFQKESSLILKKIPVYDAPVVIADSDSFEQIALPTQKSQKSKK